jgi:nucleoside 2-deoxyribosyltransferase
MKEWSGAFGASVRAAPSDEADSGEASEIGFAAALAKTCHGLRTDFRDCGEFDGQPFNLQVSCWIESSGGTLLQRVEVTKF